MQRDYAKIIHGMKPELRKVLLEWAMEKGVSEITMAMRILEAECQSRQDMRESFRLVVDLKNRYLSTHKNK